MPIVVNPNPPPRFQVVGRVGFHRGAAQFVDTTTGYLQKPLTQSALGPVERAYNPAIPHQDLRGPGRVLIQAGQDTMRAHHIADSQIQQMVERSNHAPDPVGPPGGSLPYQLDRRRGHAALVLHLAPVGAFAREHLRYRPRELSRLGAQSTGETRDELGGGTVEFDFEPARRRPANGCGARASDRAPAAAGAVGLDRLFRRLAVTLQFRPADAFCGDLPGCRRLG